MTVTTAQVLAALLADPAADRYGLELMQVTGLASGTLYPILHRLQEADWVTAQWEDIDPVAAGRPARRFYRLTPNGVEQARQALAELHRRTAVPDAKTTGTARPAW
ncbi:helix-turn-helix transcriptional regulator [Dactylosporangium sp. AC04546]|uniref:PadR family transcriptional regulator n=1 Tax=Dactylosporangium sp. AC04546 TaxID=2862460 RepID=UPI0021066D2C